ncbi:MAG: hypothetical protein ACE5GY_07600 [Thermodesulfobacteriota bacterium]
MSNNRFMILALIPFVLAAAAFFGARAFDFEEMVLRPNEIRVLHFAPETVEVRIRRGAVRKAGLAKDRHRRADLFYTTGPAAGYGAAPEVEAVEAPDPFAMKVSFIMLNGGGSRAIVNNTLVMEGDTVGGLLVRRIEHDKVLLKGKETRWVYMEGRR